MITETRYRRPQATRRLTPRQALLRAVLFALQLGVAAGAVYATVVLLGAVARTGGVA